jgi:hypothetical protein
MVRQVKIDLDKEEEIVPSKRAREKESYDDDLVDYSGFI